jgi:hypothetical protein
MKLNYLIPLVIEHVVSGLESYNKEAILLSNFFQFTCLG